MTTEFRVLLFARYAELFGNTELRIALTSPATAGQLIAALRESPGGCQLPATPFLALNGSQAGLDSPLAQGDEIALLPPLAGG